MVCATVVVVSRCTTAGVVDMSKDVDKSGPKAQEKARSNYIGQEHESRRIGLQDKLKEKVVEDAGHDPEPRKRALKAYAESGGVRFAEGKPEKK